MVDISDSSFSSYAEEDSNDSQDESFFYDTYVDDEILVDFGDDQTERNEIAAEIEDSQDETGGEIQILAGSRPLSADVWKYFTRKETTIRNQNDEETEIIKPFIFCNIGECHLSNSNSTSTLERHLKAKHYNAYLELYEKKIITELWPKEMQEAKHEFLVNWVIIDQQPFTVVDNLSFQKFMLSVQP